MDQAVMAPVGLGVFFLCLSAMEGKPPREVAACLRYKYAPTLAANYLLWPAANGVNFALVPADQRVLYVNCIGVS